MSLKVGIDIKRVRKGAALPEYKTEGAAAMDLCSAADEAVTLSPGERALIPAGIALAVPEGFAAFVFARSGLAAGKGLALANGVGVVDPDYRGELCVSLVNLGNESVSVAPGDRVAQLAILPVARAVWNETAELGETARGKGGFGSTGV